MTLVRAISVTAAFALSLPTIVSAQTCLGLPSFSRGPVNLRGGYASSTGARQYSGGIQAGGRSVFGGVSASAATYDGYPGTGIGGSFDLGTQIPLGDGRSASLCPVVEAGVSSGPNGTGYTITGHSIAGGLALGANIAAGESFHLLPNMNGLYVSGGNTIKVGTQEVSGTSSYGSIEFGLGLLFGRTFAVTPYIAIPVGLDNSTNTYGLYVSLALGGRR